MIDTFSNTLLFCFGFGLIMQRTAIAGHVSWEQCARMFGVAAPDTEARRLIVLVGGLAFACTGLLRFVA